MQVGHFPASAANSLIQGYCDDFISLAAVMAQTLEQVSIRGIRLDQSRPALERIERGMCALSSAIRDLLERANDPQQAPAATTEPTYTKAPAPAAPTARPPSPAPAPAPQQSRQTPRPVAAPHSAPAPQPAQAPRAASTPPPAPRVAPAPKVAAEPPVHHSRSLAQATKPGRPAPVVVPATSTRDNRREALRGNNKSMPLLSVFQFLGRMRKSGTMHVFIRGEILAFEFANGCIQSTASDLCPQGERLGDLMVDLGFCTREVLEPILATVGVSAAFRLGHYCVEHGIASNGQVLEALEEQVKRRFQRVCNDADASYEFDEGRRPPGDGRIRIAPFELAFEPTRMS